MHQDGCAVDVVCRVVVPGISVLGVSTVRPASWRCWAGGEPAGHAGVGGLGRGRQDASRLVDRQVLELADAVLELSGVLPLLDAALIGQVGGCGGRSGCPDQGTHGADQYGCHESTGPVAEGPGGWWRGHQASGSSRGTSSWGTGAARAGVVSRYVSRSGT